MPDAEIDFEVRDSVECGYTNRAVGHNIFTQGDEWDDLKLMLGDAVVCHFEDGEAPLAIRMHVDRRELIRV